MNRCVTSTADHDAWERQPGPRGRRPWPLVVTLLLAPVLALWTAPQTLTGLVYAALKRVRGTPARFYRFGPFLFLVVPDGTFAASGISLGLVVLADRPAILEHEFCHLYSGLWLSWLYLPVYGLEYLILGHDRSFHERLTCWIEKRNQWRWQPLSKSHRPAGGVDRSS